MKQFYRRIKKVIKESSKPSLITYIILRILVIICMIRELMIGNIQNALLCVLSLILFLLPAIVEETFKIDVPTVMNIISGAQKAAFKNSAYGILKAGELYYTNQLLESAGMSEDKIIYIFK